MVYTNEGIITFDSGSNPLGTSKTSEYQRFFSLT